jgi:hypothetical protein
MGKEVPQAWPMESPGPLSATLSTSGFSQSTTGFKHPFEELGSRTVISRDGEGGEE